MKDQQKRHKLVLNFAVSTWQILWSLADCLVTKRWLWNEGCLCYHAFSLCWNASDSKIYWIKPAKYGIKVFTITDLTTYSFKTIALHCDFVQEGKLWLYQQSKIMEALNQKLGEKWRGRGEDHELNHATTTKRMEEMYGIKYVLHTTTSLTQDFLCILAKPSIILSILNTSYDKCRLYLCTPSSQRGSVDIAPTILTLDIQWSQCIVQSII